MMSVQSASLRIALWLLLLLACLSFSLPAAAQSPALAEMPSVAKVRAKITGSDEFDTAARQSGAFKILHDVVTDLSLGRDVANRLTQQELALMTSYTNASSAASQAGEALLVKKGAPKTGAESPSPKMFRASEHYHYDPSFKQELLEGLFSSGFISNYNAALSAQRARAREGAVGGMRSSDWLDKAEESLAASFGVLQDTFGTVGALAALAGMALLGLSYPAIALRRSRRVGFWGVTGLVTDSKTWSEQHTHTSGGYTNANGQWVSGSSYTTSSRNDEFFIQEGESQHAVSLKNAHFAVARGHRVTAVWIGAKKKAKSWWVCRVRNHTTGQWTTLRHACRRARGSSFTTSSRWTFLVFTPACLAGYLLVGGERGTLLVSTISGVAFTYWFFGGFVMKLVHIFGDRRILARAQRFENPGIT